MYIDTGTKTNQCTGTWTRQENTVDLAGHLRALGGNTLKGSGENPSKTLMPIRFYLEDSDEALWLFNQGNNAIEDVHCIIFLRCYGKEQVLESSQQKPLSLLVQFKED